MFGRKTGGCAREACGGGESCEGDLLLGCILCPTPSTAGQLHHVFACDDRWILFVVIDFYLEVYLLKMLGSILSGHLNIISKKIHLGI